MADAHALAEKVANKAADTLEPLRVEMTKAKWPPEFRKIMWGAISQYAAILAAESDGCDK